MSRIKRFLQKQRLKRLIKRTVRSINRQDNISNYAKGVLTGRVYEFGELLGVSIREEHEYIYSPVLFYDGCLLHSESSILKSLNNYKLSSFLKNLRLRIYKDDTFSPNNIQTIMFKCASKLRTFQSTGEDYIVLPKVSISGLLEKIDEGTRVEGVTPYRHKAKSDIPKPQESEFVRFLKENRDSTVASGVRTIVFKGE